MSMHPRPNTDIPEETVRVARAAFPKGNPYVTLRNELETIYHDSQFTTLFSHLGQSAELPWRLAMVTILQFAEGLSDRQAADGVRSRIDWKYLLGLALEDPGFDFSVLSEFRDRLIVGEMEQQLLDLLLERFRERGLLKARGKQRTELDPCAGSYSHSEPLGVGWGNDAACAQQPGREFAGLVESSCSV